MKTYNRCVHIFPRFKETNKIQMIRKDHDFLYDCIEPHITLVFPFESDLPYEAIEASLKETLKEEKPFEIEARGITGVNSHGYYMFLNIDQGQSLIRDLHYRIHKGCLEPYQSEWTKDGSYKAHITVGRFETEAAMLAASELYADYEESFCVEVDRVFVEIIGEDDASIIEGYVAFGGLRDE